MSALVRHVIIAMLVLFIQPFPPTPNVDKFEDRKPRLKDSCDKLELVLGTANNTLRD